MKLPVVVCGCVLLLSACYRGEGTAAKGIPGSAVGVLPDGVLVEPAGKGTRPGLQGGIYLGRDSNDTKCCFMGGEAKFRTPISPGAKVLQVTLYLPEDIPIYARRLESATVTLSGEPPAVFRRLQPGVRVLEVPLQRSGARIAAVTITAGYAWTPKAVLKNRDPRPLSFYLKGVRSR